MDSQQVIEKLGYSNSPAFLQGERLREHHGYSFVFTQAERKDRCNLKGVYTLAPPEESVSNRSLTPVVYVCEADSEAEAKEIHRRVWNQNVVPFLIVVTPKNIRLYSGFEYDRDQSDEERVLEIAESANEILGKLSALTSERIDSEDIWEWRPLSVEGRVDRHLLADLKRLSEVLTDKTKDYRLPPEHAHTLIGKYIYLKYLRDRDILSNRRLSDARVREEDILSSAAQKEKLYQLEEYLNEFLNGSVFPLPSGNDIQTKHVQKTASVFKGSDPKSGQQVLFDIYDFSYVPIETLSVVYQQFLHQKDEGKQKGAYYTPIHLVNFVLDELDAKRPLKKGMRIFDSSCGSGAFLVQCYRRLVESIVRSQKARLNPAELKRLLVDHIFGVDADIEACRVAELSLSLTLLDYISPPDLSSIQHKGFKLPKLHDTNIFHCERGLFDDESLWAQSMPKEGYDWIVGNPPWKNIDKNKDKELYHRETIEWINANKEQYPVDNYQSAEAFAWKATELLAEDGQCGLLMPAMTLFKKQGDRFRAKFFSEIETWCIVNFANIRRYLFEEAINPAAAFFFSGEKNWDKSGHYITTYSPFAIEQSSQLNQKGKAKKMWTILVDYSTIKEIPLGEIRNGSFVTWKIAMWGTHRDSRLLDSISTHNPTLGEYLSSRNIHISEGSQLRVLPKFETKEQEDAFYANHEYLPALAGKNKIDQDKLKTTLHKQRIAFQFPSNALKKIGKGGAYLRKRGGQAGLTVSEPPHVIISASRNYILYSDDYVFVSPRQIGISGENQADLLKALALYLNSDFIRYQQWLTGASWGVERDRVNFDSLKRIPIPFAHLSNAGFRELARLFDEIVEAEKQERETQAPLFDRQRKGPFFSLDALLKQMNDRVYGFLGISNKSERWLIEDMLNVRLRLSDGRVASEATDPANRQEIINFARIFQGELDLFLDHSGRNRVHRVKVLYADKSAVMIVDHLKHPAMGDPVVEEVKEPRIRKELGELEERRGEKRRQWMYFRRCLRIYKGRRTYVFKPRQRLYWLKSHALVEADEFIAEKLAAEK
jgi:type I restriction-modification system DNA methylase subunit